jgi:hypothetical protein
MIQKLLLGGLRFTNAGISDHHPSNSTNWPAGVAVDAGAPHRRGEGRRGVQRVPAGPIIILVTLQSGSQVLPSMPVPPIEGVKDGVAYSVCQLDLSGVQLKKEDVDVTIGRNQMNQPEGSTGGRELAPSSLSNSPLFLVDSDLPLTDSPLPWSVYVCVCFLWVRHSLNPP